MGKTTLAYGLPLRDLDTLIERLHRLRAEVGNARLLDIGLTGSYSRWINGRCTAYEAALEVVLTVDSAPLDAPEQPC